MSHFKIFIQMLDPSPKSSVTVFEASDVDAILRTGFTVRYLCVCCHDMRKWAAELKVRIMKVSHQEYDNRSQWFCGALWLGSLVLRDICSSKSSVHVFPSNFEGVSLVKSFISSLAVSLIEGDSSFIYVESLFSGAIFIGFCRIFPWYCWLLSVWRGLGFFCKF